MSAARLTPDEIVQLACDAIIEHTTPILKHFRLGEFAVATKTPEDVLGRDLKVGDTIVCDGLIDRTVTNVRPLICGFVQVDYQFGGGYPGSYGVAAESRLTIVRPEPEESH